MFNTNKNHIIIALFMSLGLFELVLSQELAPVEPYSDTFYKCPVKSLTKKAATTARKCRDAWYRGCLCYKNGKCDTTWINECQSCKNKNVDTLNIGEKCPNQVLSENECFMTSPMLAIDCFFPSYQPSCVCYTNGTCADRDADRCMTCQQTFVETIATGENCKGVKYEYFIPKRCNIDPKLVRCSSQRKRGCVCYKDGTCANVRSNFCLSCIKDNVASFNENEACPKDTTNYQICPIVDESKEVQCPDEDWVSGCVCREDGACAQESYFSPCQRCQQSDVSLVIVDGKCPIKNPKK